MDSAAFGIAVASLVAVVVLGGWTTRAAVRAASQAAVDAKLRRVQALLDTVLEMRDTYSSQCIARDRGWAPAEHSVESLARLTLHRRLEVQLVPFSEPLVATRALTHRNWGFDSLKLAQDEVKDLLLVTVNGPERSSRWLPPDNPGVMEYERR